MDVNPHNLETELYDLMRSDQSAFEFLKIGSLGGIWYLDLKNPNNQWISPQFWTTLGYDPDRRKNPATEWHDLIHPEDLHIATDIFKAHCPATGNPIEEIVRFQHKNGSTAWIRCRCMIIRDKAGQPTRLLCALNDITAQKTSEETLQQRMDAFRMMADRIPGMIYQFVLHKDGTFSIPFISDRVLEYSGYNPEQIVAEPSLFFNPIPPEDIDNIQEKIKQSAQNLTDFEVEHRLATPSGQTKYFNSKSTPRALENGDVLWDGISIDVTERKRNHQHLRMIVEMLDTVPNAITIHDYRGNFLYANRKAFRIHGYDEKEFMALNLRDLDAPESKTLIEQRLKLIAEKGEAFFSVVHRKKDGSTIPMEVFVKLIDWADSRAMLSVATDISERKKAEETLKHERDLLERIMETSPAGIIFVNAIGHVVYANRRAEEILGVRLPASTAFIYDDSAWKITNLKGESFPEDKKPLNVIRQTGKPVYNIQHAVEGPSGVRILVSINAAPLIKASGKFDGMVATIDEITEKFKAEQNYKMLFREMLDGFALHEIICDDKSHPVNYRYLAVNPAFERLTGLSGKSLVGKTVLDVMPNTESYWIERYGRVALTGQPDTFENYAQEIGRYFHVTAFRYAKNQFACIFVDITQPKRAEEDRKKLQAQLSNAVEIAHLSHWEYDVVNDLFTFNDQFYKIFRTSAQEVGGYTMRSAEYAERFVHPEDRAIVGVETQKAIQATDPDFKRQLEHRILYADGSVGYISVQFFLEKDAKGNTIKTYGVNQDITERKRIEERLQQAQKMESIGNLAGGIAHDFNNILYPIVGMAEMLIEDLPPDSPERLSAQEILQAGKRGSDLVKQILAFSRKSEQKMIPVGVHQVLKEVLKLTRATIPSNIEIVQELQTDCGLILADPIQIHQVAMNLITNAYHAVEQNGGSISVHLRNAVLESEKSGTALDPGEYVVLTVSDTGPGIPASILTQIFEPYFTTKAHGKGTGLGLAVVYGIVKEHNGEINVHSEEGEGTTFNVYFPLIKKPDKTIPGYGTEKPETGNERILVVDDEESIARLEKQMLERLGYRVTKRTSSIEALEAFKANPTGFDLVISDMTMPNMTGDQLAKELIALNPQIPIIICTGFSERINKEKAEIAGIKGFLMKPVTKSKLAQMIRKVLDMT